jgi:hypothetical protein
MRCDRTFIVVFFLGIIPHPLIRSLYHEADSKILLCSGHTMPVRQTCCIWLTCHCLQIAPSELLFTFSPKRLKRGKLSLKLLVIGDETDEVPQRGKKRNAAVRAVVDPMSCTTLARTPRGTPDSWPFYSVTHLCKYINAASLCTVFRFQLGWSSIYAI